MSYPIIFETKICKLDNGDIIHFSLKGCNNDTEGRSRDDFHAKLYTADEWEREISKWESIESKEGLAKLAQLVKAQGGDDSYIYHPEKFEKQS